jgi:tetratricopeptide (TPR) repeat protein
MVKGFTMSRIVISLFCLLTFGFLNVGSSFSQDALDPREVAKQLRDAGAFFHDQRRYKKAITAYSESLELVPNAMFYVERGNVWEDMGKLDEAIADCDRAIELKPTLYWAYSSRGSSYVKVKNYQDALSDYTTAIDLAPKEATLYASRAKVRFLLEEYDLAIDDLDEAVRIEPDRAIVLFYRAACNAQLRNWGEMLADAETMISLDPKSADAYALRGEVNLALNHIDKACLDFSKANDLGNLSPGAKNQLTHFLLDHNFLDNQDDEQVLSLYLNLHRLLGGEGNGWTLLASIYVNLDHIKSVFKQHSKPLEHAPTSGKDQEQ